ncbi:MAG TPA: DUF4412 domain-containing protein [Gemmatimonadales bacterium]|jgi:hypothetical protein|nr:DUF4412 domain-containing protein [Gemmatimonadales bacterium]
MRSTALVLLLPLLAAAPLAAQFEGTLVMKVSSKDSKTGDVNISIAVKDHMSAMTADIPSPQGAIQIHTITDNTAGTTTMLLPLTGQMASMAAVPGMAGAKGLKMTMNLNGTNGRGGNDSKTTFSKLGTSEKIAGYDCDDYEITSGKDKPMRACLTSSFGHFMMPTNPMSRGSKSANDWSGSAPGFPLKAWDPDGKVSMEVMSITPGSVPAGSFDIPDDYMDMSAMMRGMRGGGR